MPTDLEPKRKPRKRRAWAISAFALMAVAAFATWRATSLSGLPDVGDPFDVAAFSDVKVSDDRNAFTLYRQATKLLTQPPRDATHDWLTAGSKEKQWLETNREAFEVWRQGTERPEALYVEPAKMNFATILPVIQELRTFSRGAAVEAGRLEASGEMDAALTWYLAMLRSGRHCGMRGVIIERLVGIAITQFTCARISRWAADPRVNATMLRRAIAGALAAEAMNRPASDVLKCEYMSIINSIDDPKLLDPALLGILVAPKSDSAMARLFRDDLPRILKREPERSRRVIRLIYANELAYCDLPPAQRPPIAATLPSDYVPPSAGTKPGPQTPGTANVLVGELYTVDPSAPAAAWAMPPAEVARWFDSTVYAKICLPFHANLHKAIARDRATQASLLATLRSELEKREHPQPTGAKPDADRP